MGDVGVTNGSNGARERDLWERGAGTPALGIPSLSLFLSDLFFFLLGLDTQWDIGMTANDDRGRGVIPEHSSDAS